MNASESNHFLPTSFRKTFLPEVYYLHMYMTPMFLTVGFIGNSLSFVVWMSKSQRHNNSSAIYLGMLAINDFLLMIPALVYYLTTTWDARIIDKPWLCQIFQVSYLYFQYNSLPLVFGFTIERWIAICYPFKREYLCNENRAWLSCSVILFTVFVCVFPQGFAWQHQTNCQFSPEWMKRKSFMIYQSSLEFVVSAVIPVFTIGFNIRVLCELYRITVSANVLLREDSLAPSVSNLFNKSVKRQSVSKHSQTSCTFKSTTRTLLLVSFFHILTTLPLGTVYICQMFLPEGSNGLSETEMKRDATWIIHFKMHTAKEVIDLFSMSHYCFNIVIYMSSSSQFRHRLKEIMGLVTLNKEYESSKYRLSCRSHDSSRNDLAFRRQQNEPFTKSACKS